MGLIGKRKYGTARHQPGCAVLCLIFGSRNFPRTSHAVVGGISQLGEDRLAASIKVDKLLFFLDIVSYGIANWFVIE
jgi:hypothetical protein